jgi:hypothetical protein
MQAIQIICKSRKIKGMKSRTDVVYAVTSQPAAHTTAAALATWIRGHRCVENRLRWVRDATSDEVRSPVRTANGQRIMAFLRGLAISILRPTGAANIAQAARHHPWDPLRPVASLLTS